MSTRIHCGFRMHTRDLNEAYAIFHGYRPHVANMVTQAQSEFLAWLAVDRIDDYLSGFSEVHPGRVYSEIRAIMDDRHMEIKRSGHRDPAADFDFEIVLVPTAEAVLGLHYTEQDEWSKWLLELDCLEEYYYWNNTDRPNHLDAAQWEKRRQDWEVIGHSAPADVGLSMQLRPSYLAPPTAVMVAEQIGQIDRLTSSVRKILIAQQYTKEKPHGGIRSLALAQKWLRSTEGQQAEADLREKLRDVLVPITADMLTRPWPA